MLGIGVAGVGVNAAGGSGSGGPTLEEMEGIVAAWRADAYSGAGMLKDLSGNRHHLKLGTTVGAQVLDCALEMPFLINNHAITLNTAALQVVGALQVDADVHLDNWRPGGSIFQTFVAKRVAKRVATAGEYAFRVGPGGDLQLYWYEGATVRLGSSTALVPHTAGGRLRVRATRTFSGATATIKFFTSADGITYTQLGDERLVGTGGAEATATTIGLVVANIGDSVSPMSGRIFSATVRNGIDGPVVASFDPSAQADGATSWVSATGETWTVNRTTGADTNDPTFLPFASEKYLALPGAAGNYASTPDAPANRITGDVEINVDAHHATWRPSGNEVLVARRAASSGEVVFRVPGAGTGFLQAFWYDSGGLRIATTPVGLPVGPSRLRLRCTRTTIGSTATVRFFTSTDGVSYSQLGADLPVAVTGAALATTLPLTVGADATSADLFNGRIYSTEVRNGIDGPVVARFDASRSVEPHTAVTSETGETWTIHRSTTGRKAVLVDRPLFLLGTDDYMETPSTDLLNMGVADFTVVAVFRKYGATASTAMLMSKKSNIASLAGWTLFANTSGGVGGIMADGTTNVNGGTVASPDGLAVLAVRRQGASWIRNALLASTAATTAHAVGSVSSVDPLLVGRGAGGTPFYADMEFIGAAIFRRALDDAELARVAALMGVAA